MTITASSGCPDNVWATPAKHVGSRHNLGPCHQDDLTPDGGLGNIFPMGVLVLSQKGKADFHCISHLKLWHPHFGGKLGLAGFWHSNLRG